VFLIDDSPSETPSEKQLWTKVRQSLDIFSKLATRHDPDGVDLAFVYAESMGAQCLGTDEAVMSIFDERSKMFESPSSEPHPLVNRLKAIIEAYVKRYESDPYGVAPLNLIVITRGKLGQPTFDWLEDLIMESAKILDEDDVPVPEYQLGIQFVVVGGSKEAKRNFSHIDTNAPEERHVRDIVDYTPFDPDAPREDGKILCKIMCGGIVKAWDKKPIRGEPQSPSSPPSGNRAYSFP